MADLDRAEIVELLGRLGAEDNEAVLSAARELARKLSASGLRWDDVVRASLVGAAAAGEAVEPPASARDEVEAGELTAAEAAKLVDALLARKTLSDTTREDLVEMKRAIADGRLDAMDTRYIRALAKRLGA